jgi:hypothetical protein
MIAAVTFDQTVEKLRASQNLMPLAFFESAYPV